MVARWDPFAEMVTLRDSVNRLFNETAPRAAVWTPPVTAPQAAPSYDLYETGDHIVARFAIPGMNQEQLEITITRGVLTIKGYRGFYSGDQEKEATWHVRGLAEGSFQFALALPFPVDADRAEAGYEGGILTIQLPKAEAMRPKRIAVKGGAAQPALAEEATASSN